MTYYGIQAFIKGSKVEKFTLGAFCVVAIGMVSINLLMKIHLKSMVWMLLLGIYVCLDNITTLLIMVAICTILEELVFNPFYKHFKSKYIINKEIDKRLE
jgi:hypothetical protein